MIEKLVKERNLPDNLLIELLSTSKYDKELFEKADAIRQKNYGKDVYIRGLIEISNYCKNSCYYCGINCKNKNVGRYRLSKEEILDCCQTGYGLGFRTFVLQGGEDAFFTDEVLVDIVSAIRNKYKDCAITISLGERTKESYKALFNAGANRYLLRHESADNALYSSLHPKEMSLDERKKCLFDLKEIGFQTGSGFMVGAPGQTINNIVSDIAFLKELQPEMIGIGPFINHPDTVFKDYPNGDLHLTLRLIALLRIMFPLALIPATTALATLNKNGRKMGLRAGANVVMPNLSPLGVRKLYSLYRDKIATDQEGAETLKLLKEEVEEIGYNVVVDIGNAKTKEKQK